MKDSPQDDLELLSRYVMATQQLRADWTFWPESVIRDGETTLAPLSATLGLSRGRIFAGALLAEEVPGDGHLRLNFGTGLTFAAGATSYSSPGR